MMMGTLSTVAIPDFATPAEINRLFALIAVLADPALSKATLEQIATAASTARIAVDDAAVKTAALSLAASEHRKTMDEESKQRADALVVAQASFDSRCNHAMGEVRARKAEAAELVAQAKADATAVAGLKADLRRRLEIARTATAGMTEGALL
jgi:hypothetical protein